MNRYQLQEEIGDGTFGRVIKAKNKETDEIVAIKHIKSKFKNWKSCINLREVQSLRVLSHPNLVSIKEVIREEDDALYFVFEYLSGGSLYELTKRCIENGKGGRPEYLPKIQIQSFVRQILCGLSYIHEEGFVHRDIKVKLTLVNLLGERIFVKCVTNYSSIPTIISSQPENILINNTGTCCKVADFGLARRIYQGGDDITYYVSTRWYRAPEIILHCSSYGKPIDLFSTGLILYELISLRPMLPGSSEIDQISKLMKILGQPSDWEEGIERMKRAKLQLSDETSVQNGEAVIQSMLPRDTQPSVASLIYQMIQWIPIARPTCEETLQHDYFQSSERSSNEDTSGQSMPLPKKNADPKKKYQRTSEQDTNDFNVDPPHHHRAGKILFEQRKTSSQQIPDDSIRVARLPLLQPKKSEPENNEFSDYFDSVTTKTNISSVGGRHPGDYKGNRIRSIFPESSKPRSKQVTSNDDNVASNPFDQINFDPNQSSGRSSIGSYQQGKTSKKSRRRARPHNNSSTYGGRYGRVQVSISRPQMPMQPLAENSIQWGGIEEDKRPVRVSAHSNGDPFNCLDD